MTTGVCLAPLKHVSCESMRAGYETACCYGGVVPAALAPAQGRLQHTAAQHKCSRLLDVQWTLCSTYDTEAAPSPLCPLQGFVYLKFADANGAAAAQRALHGRFFAGRQLSAEFQFLHPYNQHFRC
jgi:hypothetical protein